MCADKGDRALSAKKLGNALRGRFPENVRIRTSVLSLGSDSECCGGRDTKEKEISVELTWSILRLSLRLAPRSAGTERAVFRIRAHSTLPSHDINATIKCRTDAVARLVNRNIVFPAHHARTSKLADIVVKIQNIVAAELGKDAIKDDIERNHRHDGNNGDQHIPISN